ncbi:hypothetical protein PIB30_073609 [Stylosanthes scabra]|uniref:Uncharacterized protein n=1 Tax=Stylosanthes scabra TaxID=79078 RepID=A0ABU6QRN2_9FABA|nr:hypothetical protein [Stylosanthes scabra]
MTTPQRKRSTQSCGSACVGSPSFVKNRKKKFDYNNGKCLHDLDRRADLHCDYFVWVDEIGDNEKSVGVQKRVEESYNKVESYLGAKYSKEDVRIIMNTMTYMVEELKAIRKLIHGICVGIGVLGLLLVMYQIMK